ncbi:MAG: DUF2849 domain-containing protein [Alphaproteobacteria bacterium]
MSKIRTSASNSLQAITANRLSDGYVIYLTAKGGWSERIEDCQAIDDPATADELLRRAERRAGGDLVVGPYLFKIARRDGRSIPLGQREILRTTGPSVGTDLNLT